MSQSHMQNIVIVGAASGGGNLARNLEKSLQDSNIRIVLIDMQSHAYWPISSLRAAVVPGWENKAQSTTPLNKFFPSGSRHIVLSETEATSLSTDSITVKTSHPIPEGLGESLGNGEYRIPFVTAAIATGSKYAFPSRPATTNEEENKAALRKMQQEVKDSQSVLVIGGGAVGIEFAGEVRAQHPDKKITLAHSQFKLVGKEFSESLSNSLIREMRKMKIDVLLGSKVTDDLAKYKTGALDSMHTFTLENGHTVEADFLLVATGNQPNVKLIETLDPALVSKETGRMLVDHELRLKDKAYSHIFAFGDASESLGGKLSFAAGQQAGVVAHNIQSFLKKQPENKLKAWKGLPMTMIMVPLGPSNGAAQVGWLNLGGWATSFAKGKSLFYEKFDAIYGTA